MSKTRRNIGIVVGTGFMVSYCFTLGFDMGMMYTHPYADAGKITFIQAFETQGCGISTGVSQVVLFGSMFNLIALIDKKAPRGFSDKENDNFVVAMAFVMFAVYGSSLMVPGAVEGFKTGNQILKSSIEHIFNPILLFVMYFTLPKPNIKTGHYAKHQAGGVVLFVGFYIVYAVLREEILIKTNGYHNGVYKYLFPYGVMDPGHKPPYVGIPAIIGIMFAPYGLEVLFNYLTNLSYQSMKKRHPNLYLAAKQSLFASTGTRLNARAEN